MPSIVHFVGSVPLKTIEDVMETLSARLPNRLKSIPDGEPGDRRNFVEWQREIFPKDTWRPFFLPPNTTVQADYQLKLEDIMPTRWDEFAMSSYAVFLQLRQSGKIAPDVRFQVCLPTPSSVVTIHLEPRFHEAAEGFYAKLLLSALKNIQDQIPHRDLAIQFDMPIEMAFMEHAYGTDYDSRSKVPQFDFLAPYFSSSVKEGIVKRFSRVAQLIAPDVEFGIHLCYGDEAHAHFVQPKDSQLMVDLYKAMEKAITRPVDWLHVPVPKDRKDPAFYKALIDVYNSKTVLALGLVHANDEEGTKERIEVARKVLGGDKFAIATECGLGRTPTEELESILKIAGNVTKVTK